MSNKKTTAILKLENLVVLFFFSLPFFDWLNYSQSFLSTASFSLEPPCYNFLICEKSAWTVLTNKNHNVFLFIFFFWLFSEPELMKVILCGLFSWHFNSKTEIAENWEEYFHKYLLIYKDT